MRAICVTAMLVALLSNPASAQHSLDAQSQAIVEQLTLDRATAIATLQRRAEAREATLLSQLSQRDRELRNAIASRDTARGAREALESELASLTAERQRLIAGIAGRDSQFAAEIAEYRAQIASIAASPDPRKRAALARYAAGDRMGAMDVLIDIQTAETRAVAAGWIDVAERAREQFQRGELSLDEAIELTHRAAEVNDTNPELWRTLAALLRQAGRTSEAENAEARARL